MTESLRCVILYSKIKIKKGDTNTMTKKQAKEKAKKMRVFIPMNTGTRVEQTKKSYNRRTSKQETRRLAKDYD